MVLGEARDVVVTVGEGGGIWVNDRDTGEFVWATPFPFDTPHFILSDIDVETGATRINWDLVLKEPGDNSLICYWNTRSFWPTAASACARRTTRRRARRGWSSTHWR